MGTLTMDTPLAQSREILAQPRGLIVEPRAENARPRSPRAVGRGLVAQLQERMAELEAKLGPPFGKGTPDFVKTSRKKAGKEGPRKKREKNFARKREEPTKRTLHAVESCSGCGCRLLGGSVKRTRQLLHVPVVPVEVTLHVYLERECPQCGKRNSPDVDLSGEVVGKSRLSAQTMAPVATTREVGRLQIRSIQCRCGTFHRLSLNEQYGQ